jgi:hypothetical protein
MQLERFAGGRSGSKSSVGLTALGDIALTAARDHDGNAGHFEEGSGNDPGFHGSVLIAKSDLPRRR